MSGDCFSILVILILHRFDRALLHASLMVGYLYSMFLLFFIKIKIKIKIWGEVAGILFFLFLVCQILHVFLPDISIHCALIDYAYI